MIIINDLTPTTPHGDTAGRNSDTRCHEPKPSGKLWEDLQDDKLLSEYNFRSNLERDTADDLRQSGASFLFEPFAIHYETDKPRSYTPDFILDDSGIIIETKGRFRRQDRAKHLSVREHNPDLDIRFVFSNAYARLRADQEMTCADWCERHGFRWADKRIPDEWRQGNPRKQEETQGPRLERGIAVKMREQRLKEMKNIERSELKNV